MKCNKCGFENNTNANYCKKCGADLVNSVPVSVNENSYKKTLIICSTIVIIILLIAVSLVAVVYMNDSNNGDNSIISTAESSDEVEGEWVLISSYSGKGSGKESISVPSGKIMIKISAFPIKNYATNHLYVSGSNGVSAGVDWGSNSAVATRSDSVTFTSSSSVKFKIDYYETVNWQVEVYRYE